MLQTVEERGPEGSPPPVQLGSVGVSALSAGAASAAVSAAVAARVTPAAGAAHAVLATGRCVSGCEQGQGGNHLQMTCSSSFSEFQLLLVICGRCEQDAGSLNSELLGECAVHPDFLVLNFIRTLTIASKVGHPLLRTSQHEYMFHL